MSIELINVWLDDEREPPERGWLWVQSVYEAMVLLRKGIVSNLSLDHNLGKLHPTGMDLLIWMNEHGRWPQNPPVVHSRNPSATEIMRLAISAFWRRPQ